VGVVSGCWPVVKAAVAVIRKPVAHGVHHFVGRRVARRAVKAGVHHTPPAAPSGGCVKAPGDLPAGPGAYVAKAPVAKTVGAALVGGGAAATAALFRADADTAQSTDGTGGNGTDVSSTGGSTSDLGGSGPNGFGGGYGVPDFGAFGDAAPPGKTPGGATPLQFAFASPDPTGPQFQPPDGSQSPRLLSPVKGPQPFTNPPPDSPGPGHVPDGPPGEPVPGIPDPQPQHVEAVPEPSSVMTFAFAAIAVLILHRLRRA
jgi:hypothetical protein